MKDIIQFTSLIVLILGNLALLLKVRQLKEDKETLTAWYDRLEDEHLSLKLKVNASQQAREYEE